MSEPLPEFVLELDGLEQRLSDPVTNESFVVRVDQPLRVPPRSVAALLGPSGCGKTTLLTVLGLLRAPSNPQSLGRFLVRTRCNSGKWQTHDLKAIWSARNQREIEALRRRHFGFALQSGELLPALTVSENIASPLRLNGYPNAACIQRVGDLLTSFGLNESTGGSTRSLANQRVNRLSGGEYQRVAIARALAHYPTLLFVDEPTSALNRELAHGALTQLRVLQRSDLSQGAAIMITHDEELAKSFSDLIIRMAPRRGEPIGEVVDVSQNTPFVDDV